MNDTLARRLGASLVITLLLLSAGSLAAQEPPATKEQKVRELLAVMRAADLGLQVIDGMIGGMKEALPAAPDEFWTSFRQKIKASDLVDMLVPVYAKHLDTADIDELIRFYRTPAGQRFLDKQPVILEESMAIGEKWGEQLAARAVEDLQKTQHKE